MRDRKNGFGLGQGLSLLIIGVVLIAIGLSLGGQWKTNRFFSNRGYGNWNWKWNWSENEKWEKDYIQKIEEISGVIGSDIRKINIDLKAGSLEILVGDEPSYRASDFEKDTIKVEINSGTLRITEKNWTPRFGKNYTPPIVSLVLPKEVVLEFFELDMGAGSVKGTGVKCESVVIDTGAGSLDFKDSYFEKTDINTGAGRVQFTGVLGKRTSISTGAGSVEMKIDGSEDDYRIEFERGLGAVRIGKNSWSGIGDGFAGNRNADKEISISTGVGAVKIDFY